MSFNPLSLAKRVFNTVNNDVVHPTQHFIHSSPPPLRADPTAQNFNAYQRTGRAPAPLTLNSQGLAPGLRAEVPVSPASYRAGGDAVRKANQQYHFTPQFLNTIWGGQPFVEQGNGLNAHGGLFGNRQAAGLYHPGQKFKSIALTNTTPAQQNDTLTHEGLHRAWDSSPADRKKLAKIYNQNSTPDLRRYLQGRLAVYSEAQGLMDEGGVYKNDLSRLESLPQHLQNEIHSYIPEYYATNVPVLHNASPIGLKMQQQLGIKPSPQPKALANYYSQYFAPNYAGQKEELARKLIRQHPQIFRQPSVWQMP
jgi:hypothetical protein